MPDCLAGAVNAESSPVEVLRRNAGAYDGHGRWRAGGDEYLTISAAVQPLRSEEILRLEDSRHVKAAIKIYTTTLLRTVSPSGAHQPDIVTWCGAEYEVEGVDDWSGAGGYVKVIAVRREGQG